MSKHDERDRLLGHEDEADGIQEYDNPLPDWWLGLLWVTIIWSAAYLVHYHFIADRSPQKALAAELAAAEERWPEQAPAAAALVLTEESAEAGEVVYKANCVPCHGAELKGGIGPSLVDDEWIHGGQATDILTIIREGVPARGMVPWQGILSPEQINQVAAYVITKNSEATGRAVEDFLGDGADAEGSDGPEANGPPTG